MHVLKGLGEYTMS